MGTLREGVPVTTAVVSTAMGVHLVIDAVKISWVCVPGGGGSGTCRVYMAEEVGINRNVIDDLA